MLKLKFVVISIALLLTVLILIAVGVYIYGNQRDSSEAEANAIYMMTHVNTGMTPEMVDSQDYDYEYRYICIYMLNTQEGIRKEIYIFSENANNLMPLVLQYEYSPNISNFVLN